MAHTPTLSRHMNGTTADGVFSRIARIYNPATAAAAKNARLTSTSDVATTVAAAHAAYPRWRDSSPANRQTIMLKFRGLSDERCSDLADILTAEHGKAIVEDLNWQVRRSLSEAATRGCPRIGAQRVGFQGFYDFSREIEVDSTGAVALTRSADIRSDTNTDTGEGLP